MKKLGYLVGALALLGSSAGIAATVTLTATCAQSASCSQVQVGQSFSIQMDGAGFPDTAGATLLVNFNGTVASIKTPTITNGIVLAPASPFTGGVIASDPALAGSQFTFLAGNPPAALPTGSFSSVVFNFTALAAGALNFSIGDDGLDNVWTDANTFEAIPVTYNYTNSGVTVQGAVVPLPASVWLLGTALGLVGIRAKAKRRAA